MEAVSTAQGMQRMSDGIHSALKPAPPAWLNVEMPCSRRRSVPLWSSTRPLVFARSLTHTHTDTHTHTHTLTHTDTHVILESHKGEPEQGGKVAFRCKSK